MKKDIVFQFSKEILPVSFESGGSTCKFSWPFCSTYFHLLQMFTRIKPIYSGS